MAFADTKIFNGQLSLSLDDEMNFARFRKRNKEVERLNSKLISKIKILSTEI